MGAAENLFISLEEFLRRLFALSEADAVDQLVQLDVSFSQARTLFVLAHVGEPVPISEIARRLGLSQAAAGRNVDQLVRLGIVQRHESPDDRRVKLVCLSPTGLQIADQHVERKRQAIETVVQRLPIADCQRLTAALQPILAGPYLNTSTCSHTNTKTNTKERPHAQHC